MGGVTTMSATVCVTTYEAIFLMTLCRGSEIHKLILAQPPWGALDLTPFQDLVLNRVVVYLRNPFPTAFNNPDLWKNTYPGMPQLFIPQPPPQQHQQQQQLQWHAPLSSSKSTARSPLPAYEDISSDAAELDSESDYQEDVDNNDDRTSDSIIEELQEEEETA